MPHYWFFSTHSWLKLYIFLKSRAVKFCVQGCAVSFWGIKYRTSILLFSSVWLANTYHFYLLKDFWIKLSLDSFIFPFKFMSDSNLISWPSMSLFRPLIKVLTRLLQAFLEGGYLLPGVAQSSAISGDKAAIFSLLRVFLGACHYHC